MRFAGSFIFAVGIVLALFWFMQRMIHPSESPVPDGGRLLEDINVVRATPEQEQPPEDSLRPELPPESPGAPPSLVRPDMPAVSAPALAATELNAGPITVPINIATKGLGLGSGAFGGFSSGAGQSGSGYGKGAGFKGKELIPLSTARPQITDWAYQRGIEGWVEVVFTVMPNGHVANVRIVDAHPKGVFEPVAVESISNWLYEPIPEMRTVKQRVEFKLEDYKYNWR